jgi:hypothetical protein
MGYHNQTPGQQAQGDEPFFPVRKAVASKVTHGPENTCSASSKLRPRLAKFFRFFASSHSYFIPVSQLIVALFVVTHKAAGLQREVRPASFAAANAPS